MYSRKEPKNISEGLGDPLFDSEGRVLRVDYGDFLLVNKVVYGAEVPGTEVRLPALEEPGLSDVIVFNPPHEPFKNYVKRVVGIAGDTLQMRDKILYRNGSPLPEPYARHLDESGTDAVLPGMDWQFRYVVSHRGRRYRPSRDNWGPLVVPEGTKRVHLESHQPASDGHITLAAPIVGGGVLQRLSLDGAWFEPDSALGMQKRLTSWRHPEVSSDDRNALDRVAARDVDPGVTGTRVLLGRGAARVRSEDDRDPGPRGPHQALVA